MSIEFESKSGATYDRTWSKRYNDFLKEVNTKRNELIKQESKLDKQREECLHFLELEKPNAAIRAKVTKRLTIISEERRIIKNELSDIQCVYDRINGKKLSDSIDLSYNYSDEFLNDIFGGD